MRNDLHPSVFIPPRAQRGAVLYVALIMLILLALIGITAMQVAGLQERMSSNYRAVNLAFQNAEALARTAECNIEDMENRVAMRCEQVVTAADISETCGVDAGAWVDQQDFPAVPTPNVRKIDQCIAGESNIAMGVGPVGEVSPISIYQITAYQTDMPGDGETPTSAAAIDSVFKL
ncbi:pilus assembly PilX family protein [Coralloluteibacterium stylophorae]|uniref:Pilus assembly protein n=2 Tax=Coralloluteibacterium stylophorae TaxID=1776034 RepID=A0AAP2FZV4_9GAMM|nr:PilX N-terminal domain-containing pilus assembly protein [Coralloluteibacterium stylophorae]MBS7456663.1 pilus assembly protein [Coralloluteibacterium stylophorae]